ncbi:MAG: class I SAM-dependent methyltransferase [Candidatus Zambryskibacteria bacterium]|nr:class I SAM-dependent methyltransferase [Candidatus Zambryskibacteria bacterium]
MENILITEKSTDYELLDSGEGEKLERYGKIILSRPDPQTLWSKSLGDLEWKKADAVFARTGTSGKWNPSAVGFKPWNISLNGLTFQLELLPSKHIGLFPEQSVQWKWLGNKIKKQVDSGKKVSVLNLFGYTGGASLACAKAGASVCHVDASKFAVDLAHTNMKLSELSDKPIRFIVDDARKFVEREIKRGNKYDVILMDPPVYGKGAKGEVWKIEEDLLPFLFRIKNLISSDPLAIVLNGYASGYSSITYAQMLESITSDLKGKISHGELTIKESSGGRMLPCGIFTRFEN